MVGKLTLGERLIFLREEKKLKQIDVARAIGISNVVLSRYESDERVPDIETMKCIADYYDCSLDYLVGRSTIRVPFIQDESTKLTSNVPDAEQILCSELTRRDDLQTLLWLVRDMAPEAVNRVIKYIKIVEDEEV